MQTHQIDIDFFREEIEKAPVKPPPPLISEYVEGKRILPPGTPWPGFMENRRTPYLVEIMDNMSPFSPVQEQDVMKGAQIGVTFAAENVIAYWMDPCPAEILFISAIEKLLEKWATKRLEPLIDSCGYRHKIYAQTVNNKTRRTGDKTYSKEYVGGAIDMVSARSAASLRSESKRVIIIDEVDGAPAELTTGEGNYVKVACVRGNAWGHRKKIFRFSTPTTFDLSLINKSYESGDQRRYLIKCPHCGKRQPLEFGSEKSTYGMRPDSTAGELTNAYYLCDFCHDAIFNHHKTMMLSGGRWEPTSKCNKERRSYQISSLYSPVGMLSWLELYREYEYALEAGPDGMRSFVNLYLGLPYKESGTKPKLEKVIELRGGYSSGTVPDGVLYLTCFVDVQRGSEKDPNNPARLELEICGIGAGFRSWSIYYGRFEGAIDDAATGAWEKFHTWAMEKGLVFKRKDGMEFRPVLIFIDSGDGMHYATVYNFCQGWQSTFPSKGFSALRRQKKEKGDEIGPTNFKRYRAVKVSEDTILYEISTNYYKTHIYNNLKIERQPTGEQRPGFCDFPVDYNENYFRMLTAEEKYSDGSFHCPSGKRNEALDCRAGCLCAADVYLDAVLMDMKAAGKNEGMDATQLQQITHRTVLKVLGERVGVKIK